MRIIPDNFDKLFFTESVLGAPAINGNALSIPVTGLFPLKGYPLPEKIGIPLAGLLVFHGVTSSRRKLTEYIGNPQKPDGFKGEYEVIDISSNVDLSGKYQTFLFEGLMESPVAWVDWDVIAESFEFHLE